MSAKTSKNTKKYNLGLALSGGGAKGFAHLGVMQAFDEAGLRPGIISGTSAGAFASVFYADGYAPKDVVKLFENKGFREFAEFTIPQSGFFKTTGLLRFLEKHISATTFEELNIPLRVIATDIEHGTSKVFSSGALIPAIVASCSVPIVFRPMEIDGHYYVDGGLFKNFPVTTIRKECTTIVGMNVSPITELEYRSSLKYIAERSFHYMSASNTMVDRSACDYIIESNRLSVYSMFDLDNVREIYQIGYDLAIDFLKTQADEILDGFKDGNESAE